MKSVFSQIFNMSLTASVVILCVLADGSLPAFLAAFGSRKKLADADIQQLQKIIDDMRR